ncbi:MAG: hypothetical protein SR1Q5_10570, partial [Quinella sp. 1Q5]|nr:hypothetical protein [Quinella sp. 1Q5]
KGFDDNDATALVIADAWTSQRSDDSTVIINVSGKGTITLIDCWEDNLKIVSSLTKVNHYNNLNWNDESNKTFTGTSGADYMRNGGNKVKVNALGGNDYIDNNGDNVTINAGAGNDIFQGDGGNYTVDGGSDNDTIRTWEEGANISVNGGEGDDCFHNNAHKTTIIGGDGNDFVGNWGSNAHHVKIDTGDGNDSIDNKAMDVMISGGAGNDLFDNGSITFKEFTATTFHIDNDTYKISGSKLKK